MKKHLVIIFCILVLFVKIGNAQANQTLSNLTSPTAIDEILLPGTSVSIDLGGSGTSLQFRNLYLRDDAEEILIFYGGSDRFLHINGGQITGDFPEGLFMGEDAGALAEDDNNGCVGLGFSALKAMNNGDHNTAVGWRALINMNGSTGTTGGNKNTMIGSNAGEFISTGSGNTGVGHNVFTKSSGSANISGVGNIGMGAADADGDGVLGSLTMGSYNTVLGSISGLGINSGSYNIIVGSSSGGSLTSGENNTIIGTSSGTATITGSNNTIIGESSGTAITNGEDNLIIGESSGTGLTSGQDNIIIGESTGNIFTSGSNNIILGSGANYSSNTSDFLNIGNTLYGSIGSTKKIGIGSNSLPSTFNVGTGDQFQVSSAGKIVEYNDITLDAAGNGVPSEIKVITLSMQSASINTTSILSSAPAGLYRITYQGIITDDADTSSVLAFQVLYTDPDIGGSVTVPSSFIPYISSVTSNDIEDVFSGTFLINVSASTNINYKVAYSSTPDTEMVYSLRIVLEKL